jgi:hypothetical protein
MARRRDREQTDIQNMYRRRDFRVKNSETKEKMLGRRENHNPVPESTKSSVRNYLWIWLQNKHSALSGKKEKETMGKTEISEKKDFLNDIRRAIERCSDIAVLSVSET